MPTITEFEPQESTLLLDSEGALTIEFESILLSIFLKYASPSPISSSSSSKGDDDDDEEKKKHKPTTIGTNSFDIFSNVQTLSREDLNEFSIATNGIPMTDETFNEISEYLDMLEEDVEEGQERLTFKGFLQLYQLQTESDEEETWRDLAKWGYSKELKEFTLIQGSEVKAVVDEKKVEDLLEGLSVTDKEEEQKKL